ncbi:MAG: glutathione S-transferase family protein [Verrucomicrobiales bacterium]
MRLTIYQMPHSPYCIPITRALTALGIPYETIDITPHTREEVIRASAGRYYQVPLLDHDGRLIMESTGDSIDIARYVDANFAGGRLFPAGIEAAHLPLVDQIENEFELAGFTLMDAEYIAQIDDLVARTMIIRHKERKFGAGCVERWRLQHDELFEHFVGLLGPSELTLGEQAFLFGDTPVYADYALLGVVENVTYQGWNSLPDALRNIARWQQALLEFRFAAVAPTAD